MTSMLILSAFLVAILLLRVANIFLALLIRKKKYARECKIEFRRAALPLLNDRCASPRVCTILQYMNEKIDSKDLARKVLWFAVSSSFRRNAKINSRIFEFSRETIATQSVASQKLFQDATVNFIQALACSTPVLSIVLIRTMLWWIQMDPSLGLFVIILTAPELSEIPDDDFDLKHVA